MTLIRTHPGYKKKRAELFCHFFSIPDLAEAEKAIRRVDLMANHINETTGGNLDALELYLLVLHQLHANVHSIKIDDLQEFYRQTEKLFQELPPVPVDPSVDEALQMLRNRGITLNILSNTGFVKGFMLRRFFRQQGWDSFFSATIFSDEAGHSKPHPNMFNDVWAAVKKIYIINGEIEKKQVLHFGDNLSTDVQGAGRFGFSGARFIPESSSFLEQINDVLHATSVFAS